MRRYVVFSGMSHEECGGWHDKQIDLENLDLAIKYAEGLLCRKWNPRWAHIVDIQTGKIVWKKE